MGALEAILQYKAQREAQRNADLQAIPQAMAQFQAGRQQATDNLLKSLTLQATLMGPNNQVDPLKALKAQDLQSKIDARNKNASLVDKFLGGGSQTGFNPPPGTNYNSGTGALTIPVNRELTEAEVSTVAGAEKFEPLVENITKLIDEGILGKADDVGGVLKRTGKQILAEHGENSIARFLTPDDSKLEELASSVAEMRKFAFSEGGKQLSPTEKKVVFAGLTLTGKSDSAIKRDFNAAIDIIRQRKIATMGGANSVRENVSDDSYEYRTVNGVKQRRKKNA